MTRNTAVRTSRLSAIIGGLTGARRAEAEAAEHEAMSFSYRTGRVYNPVDLEVVIFAIIGTWHVDEALDSAQLAHIATNVRQQPGFVRGYWGQEVDTVALAHAVVLLEDAASAQTMADGVKAAIPSATLRVVRVRADA